jgi:outer membrane protein OmpA-like peptidoglycan-associated protein
MEPGMAGYGRAEKRSKAWRLSSRPRKNPSKDQDQQADAGRAAGGGLLGIQRMIGNRAFVQMLESKGLLSRAGDEFEQHADDAAKAGGLPAGRDRVPRPPTADPHDRDAVDSELGRMGPGSPLPAHVRAGMEPGFDADFSEVRVHTGSEAGQLNSALGADAFTYGHDVFYAAGRAPGMDPLTAHELGHVVQQRADASQHSTGESTAKRIQPSFTGSYPVASGIFEIDWQTRQGKTNTPPTHIGFDGYMRFIPAVGAPNSNNIVVTQIVKVTDGGGTDVNPGTMGAAQAPRGALGQPGVRTQDDALRGVVGGFFTDASHASRGTPAAAGSALSPDYDFSPAAPGTTGPVGRTQQPAIRGGGIGGRNFLEAGFKRSDDLADMHSAAMYDVPGTTDPHANLKFDFETVVRGVDTTVTYGVVKWGFDIVDGVVTNEYLTPLDTSSATFAEAMDRHMDFYVHEPMTFYFDFNSSTISPTELAKIDALLPYFTRNPKARMSVEGFADLRGGASRRNVDLALKRAEAVKAAMLAKGVTENRFDSLLVGTAPSTSATTNVGTGDLGGDAAVGADQDREANRWANRRVLVTFSIAAGP